MNKQVLIPFQVPWMVSPSTSGLQLIAREMPASTVVQFAAFYKPRATATHVMSRSSVIIGTPIGTFSETCDDGTGAARLLQVEFVGSCRARMTPSYADAQVIQEDAFDWSQLPCPWVRGSNLEEYMRLSDEYWMTTGIAPDPGAYEIRNSLWLREMGVTEGTRAYKHYLILGHDSYVEVVAPRYTIHIGQVLNW
jgi:hypothetical protein